MSAEKFRYSGLSDEQCAKFDFFADMLIEANKVHNLTRICERGDIYLRHFADSLAVIDILKRIEEQNDCQRRLIDIGSGAGVPGLAIAIALPGWKVTSVEATGKKVRFQQKVRDELGLGNVLAVQGRAEELAHDRVLRESFDVVTARGLANMTMLSELTLGFVKVGGSFLAWKGPDIEDELDGAKKAIKKLGGKVRDVHPYKLSDEHHFNIIEVGKLMEMSDEYPREFKFMKRSPLGK
ncbi:MAG: 16S rRNA (guanine(527)-N(7))-methyltransferase RsmG [Anaerohalosphaera sp.]|nr:16S rRNA (guanine(527)-N(7))-methyltransferase RsmG [Anaerohalosphaera sp.]